MTDSETSLPDATRVGRTALSVADLDTTAAFYRDVVGLAVLRRETGAAALGAGGTPLLKLRADDASPRGSSAAGLFHNAFRVPSRSALGDALRRVRSRWRLDGASDHRVSEALYLADPEGNGVEIYWDRPREEWPTADDGTVRMDTLQLNTDAIAALGSGDERAPPDTGVGHVHLEVTSLDASREFYAGVLGMRVRQEYGRSALFLAAGDYHHHVGLNTWNGRTAPAEGRGLAWFELVLPDRSALDAARDRFERADVSVSNVTDADSDPSVSDVADSGVEVVDPDGTAVRLRVDD